jgi:hypothetical protein
MRILGKEIEFFRLKKPDTNREFLGHTITAYKTADDARHRTNPERLHVEHIVGNLTHVTMFQINGSHLVSMLDAYSEINRLPQVDQRTHEEFLSTVMEDIHPEGATPRGKIQQA